MRLALLLLLASCQRRPTEPPPCAQAPVVVVRDGQGALVDSLSAAGVRCDAAGKPHENALKRTRDGQYAWDISDAHGPRFRVYGDENQLRVLHLDGVPFGDVSGNAVHDKAGVAVATVSTDGNRALVTGLDGAVRFAVTGASPRVAGLLAIPEVTDEDRLSLFMLWCR